MSPPKSPGYEEITNVLWKSALNPLIFNYFFPAFYIPLN